MTASDPLDDLFECGGYIRNEDFGHTLITDRPIRRFEFDEPAKTYGEGFIYLVFFGNDTLKAGRTVEPQQRVGRHIHAGLVHGSPAYMVWVSGPHANARVNERAVLDYCRRRATKRIGKEYFVGVNPNRIVDYVEELEYLRLDRLTGRPVRRHPRQAERLHPRRALYTRRTVAP
jgi:hypothetical protein